MHNADIRDGARGLLLMRDCSVERPAGKPIRKKSEAGKGEKTSLSTLRGSRVAARKKAAGYPAGTGRKPSKKIKLKTGQARTKGKQEAAAPRWIWAVGGALVLVIAIAWLTHTPARKNGAVPSAPPASPVAGTKGSPIREAPAPAAVPAAAVPDKPQNFIKAVRLQPSQPTRKDSLKAEVEAAPTAPGGLTYTYQWRVNGHIVEEATGDILNLTPFKRRDVVSVAVTPYDSDTAGFAVESPAVVIHSITPTLELKNVQQSRRKGEPLELQLVTVAPDSDQVVFSLQEPRVSGMTIDKQSGKITWRLQPDQKGAIRFGAAVEDENQTKVTKVFGINVK